MPDYNQDQQVYTRHLERERREKERREKEEQVNQNRERAAEYRKLRDSDNEQQHQDPSWTPDCAWCGKKTVKRVGKNGPFWGCSAYPKCAYTRKREVFDSTTEPVRANPDTTRINLDAFKKSPVTKEDLSMRDKMALELIPALIISGKYDDTAAAKRAYLIADAMIKARIQ
jgi:ribosomal protein L37AE/L43A